MSSSIPADEISKRFFYAGFFGLPWLWIVHTMHWYGKLRGDADEMVVNNHRQPGSVDGDNNSNTTEEITLREMEWVGRCRNSAIIVTFAWVIWIIVVQVFLDETLPASWFIRVQDQGEATGW